jgi:ABC-2 type transport system ATP-binding protein
VGLSDTGRKKAKNFSLGMRQRLGIGMALLSDPELLVLDEPVNGLDPEGIVHIRNLLLKLNHEQHMTMIISSHILSELDLLATDYIFLKKGQLLGQLSADELEQHSHNYLELQTGDASKTAVILEKVLGFRDYQVQEDQSIHLYEGIDAPGRISQALFQENIPVLGLNLVHANLEDYYMTLMGEQPEGSERRAD